MDVQVIRPTELTEEQIAIWRGMMDPASAMDSPFFDPQYSITLGLFRDRIRVAVIKENGIPVAFFPFERHGRSGHPLGIKLCDFQGIVRGPNTRIDLRKVLAGCGLKTCHFDHVLASQPEFKNWHLRQQDSFYIDLSRGFEAYSVEQRNTGSKFIPETGRKKRKLESNVGPLQFEWHSTDDEDFKKLIEWKSDQRKRTGTFDILQFEWAVQALEAFWKMQDEEFCGVLSTLKVNNRLAAASLGIKTRTARHIWISSYCRELEKYSPGNILRLAVAEASAEHGVQRIDFGKGNERYKTSLKSGGIPVAEGAVDLNPVRHFARSILYKSYEQLRSSPADVLLQNPKRFLRGMIREKKMKPSA